MGHAWARDKSRPAERISKESCTVCLIWCMITGMADYEMPETLIEALATGLLVIALVATIIYAIKTISDRRPR
jgi:Na+-driven multidrug efflux pump